MVNLSGMQGEARRLRQKRVPLANQTSFAILFIAATNRWYALTVVDPFDLVDPYVRSKTNAIRDSRIASIHACSVIVENAIPS